MKILIADDSQFMRTILKDIAESADYEVVEAQDGKETLEKLEQEKPDLLLLDVIMPNMDGMEVLKKLGGKTKVIVISAVGQEKMINEAKELGASDYIVKPFDSAKVLEVIKKVIG